MLEFMRRKTQSIAVYIVLGIIITTFVISFGPAASKVSCGNSPVLANIDGEDITMIDWNYARSLTRYFINDNSGMAYVRFAMDKIIERKLLFKLAQENGIRFAREDAEDMILNNRVIIFGNEVRLSYVGAWPIDPKTKKPADFNYKQFKNWVKYTVGLQDENQFLDIQAEEMAVKAYKDSFLYANSDSTNAKWINYQNDYLDMTFKVASFSPLAYKDKVSVSDKEIKDFLANKDNKSKVEMIYKSNPKKYEKVPRERLAYQVFFEIPGLFADLKNVKDRDLDKIAAQLPKYAEQINKIKNFLKNNAKGPVLDGTSTPPENYKDLGWVKEKDSKLPAGILKAVFATAKNTFSKPVFTEKGIYLVFVKNEKGGKLSKAQALNIIAKDMLLSDKAEQKALKAANKVLAQLKKGVPADKISDMPELMTEGPVNPIRGRDGLIDRKLATELWKLGKPGTPLGRIITTGQGKTLKYNIYILDTRNLPSKSDFEDLTAENEAALVNSKALTGYDINVKELCKRTVKSGKLEIGNQLHRILTYKKPAKVDPRDKNKKLPPEQYSPCQYVGMNMGF